MKNMKKLFSLALALVMMMALVVTAGATGTTPTGSITVDNPVEGQTYVAYKIFGATFEDVADPAGDHYSYTYTKNTNTALDAIIEEFFNSQVIAGETNKVTITGFKTGKTAADFAARLHTETTKETDALNLGSGTTLEVTGEGNPTAILGLGYYFVTSTTGTVCALDSNGGNVDIQEKNELPTVDKKVKDDDNAWNKGNTASVGDTVEYQVTVHAKPGAENYVLKDTMSKGLTFNNDVIITDLTKGTDYTVSSTSGENEATVVTITFMKSYLDTITEGKDLVVTYSATLNEKAVSASNNDNTNSVELTYGHNGTLTTTPSATSTKSYEFDLVKVDGNTGNLLADAEFRLYGEDGNEISLYKVNDTTYRKATGTETGSVIKTIDTGVITIQGLANGTYTLKETNAPEGYNGLKNDVTVTITDSNVKATNTDGVYTNGAYVENFSGTELPSTGGIGTTIFYVVGGALMIGAAVLFLTKKRSEV